MNTKFIMTSSALALGISGIAMTFAPDLIASELIPDANSVTQLSIQVIGGLYFGFAMLNWMVKGSLIGGIYNRPIAVANMTHFMISGLAIFRVVSAYNGLSVYWWIIGVVYFLLLISFGMIIFTHPLKTGQSSVDSVKS